MYIVAVLFVIAAVAKLLAGDYAGLVIALAVALALVGGQYFWDSLGGGTFWQRIRVPLALAISIAGIAVVALMLLEEIEIDAQQYVRLSEAAARFPVLREPIRQALVDRKVSVVERYEIEQRYLALARQQAIDTLLND